MTINEFQFSPDAFFLYLPATTPHVRTKAFESDWGVTDEILCYYRDTLIGQVFDMQKPVKELPAEKYLVINLTPKLNITRNYPWPTVEQFLATMLCLLHSEPSWVLHCEADCEQNPVEIIQNNAEETAAKFSMAVSYSAGNHSACPSFRACA